MLIRLSSLLIGIFTASMRRPQASHDLVSQCFYIISIDVPDRTTGGPDRRQRFPTSDTNARPQQLDQFDLCQSKGDTETYIEQWIQEGGIL